MRRINEAIIHCTATRPEFMQANSTAAKVKEIRRWHVDGNGWSDIGYHYLIDRDGTVATGRPMTRDGAHVRGRNRGTIGISLFGGHGSSKTDKFEDHFTAAQDKALRKLIADLKAKYSFERISGHNEHAAKACPGFLVKEWYAQKPAQAPQRPAQPDTGLPWWLGLFGKLIAVFGRESKHKGNDR